MNTIRIAIAAPRTINAPPIGKQRRGEGRRIDEAASVARREAGRERHEGVRQGDQRSETI